VSSALVLTPNELVAITRRERPSAQARVLRRMGVPFRVHPTDRVLQVPRGGIDAYLGGTGPDAEEAAQVDYAVNVTALRAKHGPKAQVR
jgi:hypothetical protein